MLVQKATTASRALLTSFTKLSPVLLHLYITFEFISVSVLLERALAVLPSDFF